jgi:hypothetical protein
VIIFVFDPLAICLVIAANIAFNQLKPKPTPEVSPKEYQIYSPSPPVVEESKPEQYIHPSAPLIQKINREKDDTTITYY